MLIKKNYFSSFLLLVWGLDVGSVEASASRGQLEAVDGEGEVLVIGIEDQEAVVDRLLDALGLVAFGNEGTLGAGGGAGLDSGGLGEGLVVSLDVVDHDSPVTVDVDGAEGLDVGGVGGAEISLLDDLVQTVDAVVGVGEDILVHLLDGVVVVFEGFLDLVGRVFLVFKTPGAGVADGTGRWARWAVGWGRVSVGGFVWGRTIWSWDWGIWRRSWAVPVWWRGGCVGGRCVRSRGVWSWGVRSRCVREDGVSVGWAAGSDDCHESRENLKN